jgi:GxxExxY protein
LIGANLKTGFLKREFTTVPAHSPRPPIHAEAQRTPMKKGRLHSLPFLFHCIISLEQSKDQALRVVVPASLQILTLFEGNDDVSGKIIKEDVMKDIIYKSLSDQVIKAAITVHKNLGPGLLEKLYRKALLIQLDKQGILAREECLFQVYYEDQLIGNFFADLVVANVILIETKATAQLTAVMVGQTLNYMRISGLPVGYLIIGYSKRSFYNRFRINKLH